MGPNPTSISSHEVSIVVFLLRKVILMWVAWSFNFLMEVMEGVPSIGIKIFATTLKHLMFRMLSRSCWGCCIQSEERVLRRQFSRAFFSRQNLRHRRRRRRSHSTFDVSAWLVFSSTSISSTVLRRIRRLRHRRVGQLSQSWRWRHLSWWAKLGKALLETERAQAQAQKLGLNMGAT